ncbi:hypothetical protein H012_gp161 [Acanthamoeba polyphaga moumouvirus]|uniref:Uncharacterized protein n=2 Tax=Moumouvirus TaxID=3080801 RepID=L7RCG7_9VIRU|nr:hypothetical protein H012_gp161 [Acanthamoeba polyphaga moumouvirus]AEX62362.1 hypothetical protein mv_L157 [Moumouvirus Monve]AGC02289.1 hypothetical protein Moumou_00771 [Acanthamoeba polyphaga moumouvirus]AQN68630.1 hypothetical protein [Saudi moumouvirus]
MSNGKVTIEFIFTFKYDEQEFWQTNIDKNITEECMITYIFEELGELGKQLVKISCCQFINDESELLPFLKERSGKYYFNHKINKDSDTEKWHQFKKEFYSKSNFQKGNISC